MRTASSKSAKVARPRHNEGYVAARDVVMEEVVGAVLGMPRGAPLERCGRKLISRQGFGTGSLQHGFETRVFSGRRASDMVMMPVAIFGVLRRIDNTSSPPTSCTAVISCMAHAAYRFRTARLHLFWVGIKVIYQ